VYREKASGAQADRSSERIVKDIRRATRKHYSAIAESLYYTWSKEFLEAGKRRWPTWPRASLCALCITRWTSRRIQPKRGDTS
jgi:hypothetical protein